MTELHEPHLTSNDDRHYVEAIAPYGGMCLVVSLDPTQGPPIQGAGRGCR
jgi:hypothetical protein